jgi:uncharacterized protein (TIGR03382 family)
MRFRFMMLSALGALIWPATGALAHIHLNAPADRGCSNEKVGPCGTTCDPARSNATAFEPGSTITVQWDEYIDHPSHYRISFDDDGDDAFANPVTKDDIQQTPALPVLLDGIMDRDNGGDYSVQVTLPDIECDNCTLQLIQVMYDKSPPFGDNDMYYRCADLTLRRGAGNGDAGVPGMTDALPPDDVGGGGGGGGGGGCNAGGQSAPGAAGLLLALGALVYSRRRLRARI